MARQLLGKEVNAALNERIKDQVRELKERGISPRLGIIRVGENPGDLSYERGAVKRCETLGVEYEKYVFPADVTQEELLRGYMRQADYTRKTQALSDERQRIENYYRQQPQPQYQQQEQVPQQQAANLNDIAKQIAARNLGLDSPDDLSELDFDHITAVVEAKQALLSQRNQIMNRANNINNLEM